MDHLDEYKTFESNKNSIEFTLFEKFIEFQMDINRLLRFLKSELRNNIAKFGEGDVVNSDSVVERLVDNVIISNGEIVFVCEDNYYLVDNYYPITCNKNEKDDDEHFWIIGVPSGEAIRVNRYREFKTLLDKGLLFFEYKYKPTFYAFEDKDKKKIKEVIDWSNLRNFIDDVTKEKD